MKIEETIKESGVSESKKDKAVITNFDYYRDQIYEIGINEMAFDEENEKLCDCRDIKQCADCLFYPYAACDSNRLGWCIKPHLSYKFNLSKAEYDLLAVYERESESIRFQKCQILMHMKKKGHFADIPVVLTVKEILDNCKVEP